MFDLLIAAAVASLTAQGAHDQCHGEPNAPPFNEFGHYVPGFGRSTGLNDDFHDNIEDPLDVPGAVISGAAQQEQIQQLTSVVGLDCPIEVDD
jgi:hypothetical protein